MAASMEMTMDRPGARTAMPRRRFRLLDAMILVAATAAGCGLTRWVSQATEGEISWSSLAQSWEDVCRSRSLEQGPAVGWSHFLLYLGLIHAEFPLPIVAAWTLALIPIRLLGPRPRLRRLARQPGMMALCASGLAMVFVGLLIAVVALAIGGDVSDLLDAGVLLGIAPVFLSLAVLASWMTLLAGRRWRAEPSWVDRLGRAVGVFWIVAGFSVTVLWYYEEWSGGTCQFYARQVPPR